MKSAELPMVKIKSFVVGPRHDAHLPKPWLDEYEVNEDDKLEMFKDIKGRLIIMPPRRPKTEEGESA